MSEAAGKRNRRMAESFNYISLGNWEYIEGNIDIFTMGRGRMFEYTPPDTEKRLEGLDSTAIAFLEKLPTFLCSEIKTHGDAASMLIKYGRISNINLGRKEVSAAFETMVDFGEVEFEDIDAARTVFGADKFQLYRTHWAVREGDAHEVLKRLAEAKPDLAQVIAAEGAPADDGVESNRRHAIKRFLAPPTAWSSFLSFFIARRRSGGPRPSFEGTVTRAMN